MLQRTKEHDSLEITSFHFPTSYLLCSHVGAADLQSIHIILTGCSVSLSVSFWNKWLYRGRWFNLCHAESPVKLKWVFTGEKCKVAAPQEDLYTAGDQVKKQINKVCKKSIEVNSCSLRRKHVFFFFITSIFIRLSVFAGCTLKLKESIQTSKIYSIYHSNAFEQ